MSWSFQVRNGDLAHDKGQYATVKGPNKIGQDLRIWILSRIGEDEMHPWFGSSIDGGIDEGDEIGSMLDMNDPELVATLIEGELRRWADQYKARQVARIESDVATYGTSTLRKDEILKDLGAIQFRQVGDTLFIRVEVIPAQAMSFELALPVLTS